MNARKIHQQGKQEGNIHANIYVCYKTKLIKTLNH